MIVQVKWSDFIVFYARIVIIDGQKLLYLHLFCLENRRFEFIILHNSNFSTQMIIFLCVTFIELPFVSVAIIYKLKMDANESFCCYIFRFQFIQIGELYSSFHLFNVHRVLISGCLSWKLKRIKTTQYTFMYKEINRFQFSWFTVFECALAKQFPYFDSIKPFGH